MGKVENLDMTKNITFIEGDVAEKSLMEEIMKANKFDYIFHLAAVASVAFPTARPVTFKRTPPKRWTTKRNGIQPSQSRIHLIRCVSSKPYP
ncbi:hypothetical protein EfmAA242_10210 [Enterococcus faecium]|nr:hypothetical protein EfmAA242_10210 [Enterococcus faecium]